MARMRVLSDGDWELVEPFVPAPDGNRGRRFRDHRTVGDLRRVPDDAGRDAHLSGAVATALGEQTGKLFSEPTIEKLEVLASKPAA